MFGVIALWIEKKMFIGENLIFRPLLKTSKGEVFTRREMIKGHRMLENIPQYYKNAIWGKQISEAIVYIGNKSQQHTLILIIYLS